MISELETYLCEITQFAACSLQPNSGASGEYAGLLTIRAYHESKGEGQRNVILIPISAHGTNPASAVMAGYKVVVVRALENGNIDVADLKAKAEQYFAALSEGGNVTMPLDKTFFAGAFGMLKDKFGVAWIIIAEPMGG